MFTSSDYAYLFPIAEEVFNWNGFYYSVMKNSAIGRRFLVEMLFYESNNDKLDNITNEIAKEFIRTIKQELFKRGLDGITGTLHIKDKKAFEQALRIKAIEKGMNIANRYIKNLPDEEANKLYVKAYDAVTDAVKDIIKTDLDIIYERDKQIAQINQKEFEQYWKNKLKEELSEVEKEFERRKSQEVSLLKRLVNWFKKKFPRDKETAKFASLFTKKSLAKFALIGITVIVVITYAYYVVKEKSFVSAFIRFLAALKRVVLAPFRVLKRFVNWIISKFKRPKFEDEIVYVNVAGKKQTTEQIQMLGILI